MVQVIKKIENLFLYYLKHGKYLTFKEGLVENTHEFDNFVLSYLDQILQEYDKLAKAAGFIYVTYS